MLKNNQLLVTNKTKKKFLDQIIKFLFMKKNTNLIYNNIYFQNIRTILFDLEDILDKFNEKTNNKNNIRNITKEEIQEIQIIFKLISITEDIFFNLQKFCDEQKYLLKKEIETNIFKIFKMFFKFKVVDKCKFFWRELVYVSNRKWIFYILLILLFIINRNLFIILAQKKLFFIL